MLSELPQRATSIRHSCQACGCPDSRMAYAGVEVCPVCGLGRTVASTASADEQDYLASDEVGGMERPDYFRALFSAYCRDVEPGRALDVGCGRGEWVRLLNARGWTAHGIDAFRDFKPDNVQFFRASLNHYSPSDTYDLITLIHCFEHLPDPLGALRRLSRLLSPNGRLLIVVPNFGGAWSRLLGVNWHMLRPEHHAFHYTPQALVRMLQNGGCSIERVVTYSGYMPSLWQFRLSQKGFYSRGIGSVQPFRWLVFRANTLMQTWLNRRLDKRLDGAEIQVLSSRQVAP